MSCNLLSLVGLAKKAGRLEVGEEPVGAAARAGQTKLILVASTAAENTLRRATHFAEAGRVKCLCVPFTKEELGGILGRKSCAMAAFTDAGFAASFVKGLAEGDPERYEAAARQLDTKAQGILQRQRERQTHEKNRRKRSKKPPAAPVRKRATLDVAIPKQTLVPRGKITITKK